MQIPSLIQGILLLAALVIVPLGLAVMSQSTKAPETFVLFARLLQPASVILLIAAFLQPIGHRAALLALPWLLTTAFIALIGVRRLHQSRTLADGVMAVGMMYLFVGGVWVVLSRLGVTLGFGGTMALLTAVHFHYAGFAAPIITGLVGREIGDWRIEIPNLQSPEAKRPSLYPISAIGVVIGIPLVAVGITLSPAVELVGALVVALSLVGVMGVMGTAVLPHSSHRPARLLLSIAAGSVVIGMVFAMLYAISEFGGLGWLNISQMARYHGIVNAFGFCLCGLWGFILMQRRQGAKGEKALRLGAFAPNPGGE
jgi:hypothetical protein